MIERELPRVEQRPEQVFGRLAQAMTACFSSADQCESSSAVGGPANASGSRGFRPALRARARASGRWPDSRSSSTTLVSITSPPISSRAWRRLRAAARASSAQPAVRGHRPNVSRIVLARRRVGHLDRAAAVVPPVRKAIGHVGRLGQGVGHLVGGQRPRHLVREQPRVPLVARHGARRQAVGLATWRSSGSGRAGRTCGHE